MALILDGTNGLSDVDGSASTPAIRGTDANTGIFFPAADTIGFAEGGVEAMRIDSSGNVGIGTSAPDTKLSVLGNSVRFTQSTYSSGTTGSGILIDYASGYSRIASYINGFANWGNLIIQEGGGNVGIGTISPAQKLDVTGNIKFGNTTAQPTFYLNNTSSGSWKSELLFQNSGTSKWAMGVDINANGNNNFYWYDAAAGTERMRLDSSGNLGLGVTPSAWWSSSKAIQTRNAAFWSTGNTAAISANYYANSSGNDTYIASDYATLYYQLNGQHRWFTAPSGTAGNVISFTQAMTLDASGNLGIGTTSIAARLDVVGTSKVTGTLYVQAPTNTATFQLYGYAAATDGAFSIRSQATRSLTFVDDYAGAERMRIDSSGRLLVGLASSRANGGQIQASAIGQTGLVTYTNITTGNNAAYFENPNGIVGAITTNGTSTSYNTSSDYRLKNNIASMTGALATVAQLKPVTYTWKADGSNGQGFIAHELQEVVPECVTGEKDAVDAEGNPVYQGIDTSFLVATLTAAIQELKAELDTVKAELNQLKGV